MTKFFISIKKGSVTTKAQRVLVIERSFDSDVINGGNVLEWSRQLAMKAYRVIESEHMYHQSNSSVRQPSVPWTHARNLVDGSAFCGVVLRDSHAMWIAGFYRQMLCFGD
ncbi:hypothetical protein V6N12_010654 [Hibiscus sabdariffa]|uniref:Uncharacterized protein n=1 Tax=Hibiscus sabdariffa TaxID=183260 RepID=A0ABR2EL25_9ROSI